MIKLVECKNFIAARATVESENINNSILNIEGWILYYTPTGFLDNLANIDELSLDGNKNFWDLFSKSKDTKKVYLYWIREGEYEVKVPWGLRTEKYKINGVVNISFDVQNDPLIKSLLSLPIWERVEADGVAYEYLSDYFIDRNGNQNGLSIWLRDNILGKITEIINGYLNAHNKVVESELLEALKGQASIIDFLNEEYKGSVSYTFDSIKILKISESPNSEVRND